MTWARSLEFLRDRSALGWNLMFPLLMVAGMAWIFSGPGQPLFKVAVMADAPLTPALHPFLGKAHVQFYAETDTAHALSKVERHRVDMLLDLRGAQGRYWINETSPKGEVLEGLLRGVGGAVLERGAVSGGAVRYVDWLAPGVLGMNMMFSCLFGIGYVIVRYRKSGYLKRLNATPLTALEFILAQLISRWALILLITVGVFCGTDLFLDYRMEGSYAALFTVTALGAFNMIALGLVVSSRVTSEELAGGLLNVVSWPMMVLSGVFFSTDGAPGLLQTAAEFLPLTHLLTAARAVMLDGAGLAAISYQLTVLAVSALAFLLFGAIGFRWTQD
ncbi:MAG: ABC transporter permease [Pseudomonadota bacterium]